MRHLVVTIEMEDGFKTEDAKRWLDRFFDGQRGMKMTDSWEIIPLQK